MLNITHYQRNAKPQWGTISHQSEWLRSKSLQSPSRGKGTWEEVTPSQSTSLDSPDTKSSLDKHVWSWGTAQKKSKCNCVSTGAQPWHPNTCNVTREGHRRIIHGNLRKGLARNCIKSKKLIIMGRHIVIIAVSQVAWATPCISLRELVE